METTTFPRNGGYVQVVICKNGKTFIVGNKPYKTKKGCEAANAKLDEYCGPDYSLNNIPYTVTNDDGTKTELFHTENRHGPK